MKIFSLVQRNSSGIVMEIPLAKVVDHTLTIINEHLREQMELTGITIQQPETFNGKEIVHLKDPEFPKAFLDVYIPQMLKEGQHRDRELGTFFYHEFKEVF